MIEHKIIKINDSAIKILEKENWELCTIYNNKMYFKRKIKTVKNRISYEDLPETIEFKNRYKDIKKNWLYDQSLTKNYNECVKKWLHKDIMINLESYITYLEVNDKKDYALMPTTYINRKRYLDEWVVVKDMSKKFIDDICKDRKLSSDIIKNVLIEIKAREVKNPKKELTTGICNNIINYVIWL